MIGKSSECSRSSALEGTWLIKPIWLQNFRDAVLGEMYFR